MAKVLLTGGAGYIGSHTWLALRAAGHVPVILDDFSNASEGVIPRLAQLSGGEVSLYRGSVLDGALLDRIMAQERIEAVVHFAARKAVGESVVMPVAYFETNTSGLISVLGAMERAGVRALVFSSSATVYGEPDIVPTPETAPRRAMNPYGASKIIGEQILEQTAPAGDWAFGILRYFNPVGAHPSGLIGEDPDGIPNNLMPFIAKVATGEFPNLRVFGDDYPTRDGTGERDYIHVMDLARGHVLSLEALLARGTGHLVNLGTGRAYSVLEMRAAYADACGREIPFEIVPRRPGDVPIYQAEVSRAREILGFETEFGLTEMCASSWNWIETGAE